MKITKKMSLLLAGFLGSAMLSSGALAQDAGTESPSFTSPEHAHPGGLKQGDYNVADSTGFESRKARLYHMFCTTRDNLAPKAARRIHGYLAQADNRLLRTVVIDDWYDTALEDPDVLKKFEEDGTEIRTWWEDEGVTEVGRISSEMKAIMRNLGDIEDHKEPRDLDDGFLLSEVSVKILTLGIELDAAIENHGDVVKDSHDSVRRFPTAQAESKLIKAREDKLLGRYNTMIKYIHILTTWEGEGLQDFLDLVDPTR